MDCKRSLYEMRTGGWRGEWSGMNDSSALTTEAAAKRIGSRALRRVSASQQIHEDLRERIVTLELAPGRPLSRPELADQYDVSQTPVRDAMMRLEEEGLLVVRPQSRTEVSKIDVAQARETQFLRLSVELEVARRLAAARDPAKTAPARRILAQQETALAVGDIEHFARLDRAFHHALCDAAGVGELWRLIASRSGHIDRLRNLNLPDPGKPAEILVYHHRILDAIEAGDAGLAETAVRGHLAGTLASVSQIMTRWPSYF